MLLRGGVQATLEAARAGNLCILRWLRSRVALAAIADAQSLTIGCWDLFTMYTRSGSGRNDRDIAAGRLV
jgi:hypothetical protein